MRRPAQPIPELTDSELRRFWSKVALPDENGCMLWMTAVAGGGYGAFKCRQRMYRAHRISLILAVGPAVGDKTEAAHGCRNRHCVAPEHLRWATLSENMTDKRRDGTDNRGERNNTTKLSWRAIREIRRRLTRGERRSDLAKEYSVGWSTIDRIDKGEHWVESEGSKADECDGMDSPVDQLDLERRQNPYDFDDAERGGY